VRISRTGGKPIFVNLTRDVVNLIGRIVNLRLTDDLTPACQRAKSGVCSRYLSQCVASSFTTGLATL
jgi:hypothetical protein